MKRVGNIYQYFLLFLQCFHVLGQDTSEPSLVLVKPRKDTNNVSCRRDMTEILLKAAENTIQSIKTISVFKRLPS